MDALTNINELFADSLYQEFNIERYGLKNCKKRLDPDYAYEMRSLYTRALERQACGIVEQGCCCTLPILEEQINTL